MGAAVVWSFHRPVELVERPVPQQGEGRVLVRIEASGLCHTDHAVRDDWPVKPGPPFVPGHEGVGVVDRLGPGVARVPVGDRVAIPWLGYACGRCDYCVSGCETPCESQVGTGYGTDGGHTVRRAAIFGTRQDLAEVFGLHAAGRTKAGPQVRKPDVIHDAIDDVRAGHVTARVVLQS